MRRLILTLLLAMALAGAVAAWHWQQWQRFMNAPVNPNGELAIWIADGATFGDLVGQLEGLGLARPDWRWRLYGRLHAPGLKRGEFRLPAKLTIDELIRALNEGQVLEHRLTIVEGWTLAQLRERLAQDPRLRQDSRELGDEELMRRLGCEGCPAEGRFLPETYFFIRGSSDLELLERAWQAMESALDEAWSQRDPDLPIQDREELLILASLIERETGAPFERPEVAGVFKRRLERGMRLQTDPTVIYGLDDSFDGRLRRVHLRTDHPWNTYTRHGLPVTAIALPGKASLMAAARPAPGTSLYFVSRGDGTHKFSDTLREHNAAVDRYIRGR
jgi:UPF0755 protein